MKCKDDKSYSIFLRKTFVLIGKLILFLIAILTFSYAANSFYKSKFSKVEIERDVISISIDDIRDVLKVAALQIPFSEYIVPSITSLAGLTKQRVIYIERGIVTLGIDLSKVSWKNILKNDETRTITVTLPQIEVLSYWIDTQRSEYDVVSENLLVDGTKASANDSQKIHDLIKEKVYKNYCTTKNFKKAEASAQTIVINFFSTMFPDWNIEVIYKPNDSDFSDAYGI